MDNNIISNVSILGENRELKDAWAREQLESSTGGGHEIIDMDGSELPSRRKIQFMNSDITDDETNNVTEVAFDINRYVPKPKVTIGEYIYNGEEQGPVIEDLTDDVLVTNAKAIDTGTYTLTLSLKDIRYTSWMDRSTSDITYEYRIQKKMVLIPIVSGEYDFDTTEKSAVINNFDIAWVTMNGTRSSKSAGVYNIVFNLNDSINTIWQDNTTSMKTGSWKINKSDPVIDVNTLEIDLSQTKLYEDLVITTNATEEFPINLDIRIEKPDMITSTSISENPKTLRISVADGYIDNGQCSLFITALGNDNFNEKEIMVFVVVKMVPDLNECTWQQISEISESGRASSCWNIGDTKEITLNGKVGDYLTLSNYKTNVRIIGFDHNSSVEGSGISFGCFFTNEYKLPVALCDSDYGTYNNDGIKNFSINHWKDSSLNEPLSYGGWKACDMRYDILGSTDIAPSNYGSAKNTSSTGYTPSQTCISNPVSNTLMAALPSDLRSVMKLICKYTDNGYEYNNSSYEELVQAVTNSYDYLPLMSEYELNGTTNAGNTYEKNMQLQYDYYKNGNSKIKYKHADSGKCDFWLRSRNLVPIKSTPMYWCYYASSYNKLNAYYILYSSALAPVFLV